MHCTPTTLERSGTALLWLRCRPLIQNSIHACAYTSHCVRGQTTYPCRSMLYTCRSLNVSFVSLANNHSLDFLEPGLQETVAVLQQQGIAFAGGQAGQAPLRDLVLRLSSKLWLSTRHQCPGM